MSDKTKLLIAMKVLIVVPCLGLSAVMLLHAIEQFRLGNDVVSALTMAAGVFVASIAANMLTWTGN